MASTGGDPGSKAVEAGNGISSQGEERIWLRYSDVGQWTSASGYHPELGSFYQVMDSLPTVSGRRGLQGLHG